MQTLQKHETELLHYIMTISGGFMGLYAVCAHGNYASAQTGNLMNMLVDFFAGNRFSAGARLGGFFIFCAGIAVSWLLHEFCPRLPFRGLCIVIDGAALLLSAQLPDVIPAFFRLYPIFFASSFQWEGFGRVEKRVSASLFLTGNLKNGIICALRFFFYRKGEDAVSARIYLLAVASYLVGGVLGCWAVEHYGALGAYWGFLPLLAAALLLTVCKIAERKSALESVSV